MKLHRLFFYLTIIFFSNQLGYHFWPEWTFVLGRKIDYLSPTLYLSDLLIFITLCIWFVEDYKKIISRIVKLLDKPKTKTLIILALILIFSNLLSARVWQVSFYKWFTLIKFILFGIYIIFTKPSVIFTSLTITFSLFAGSVIGIIQFVFQRSPGWLWFWGARKFSRDTPGIARQVICFPGFIKGCKEALRSYGSFPHPNALAGILASMFPAVLLTFKLIRQNNFLKNKVFYKTCVNRCLTVFKKAHLNIMITASLIAAVIFSFSHSAWIILATGIIYYLFFVKINYWQIVRGRKFINILFIILLTVIAAGYLLFSDSPSESILIRQKLNAVTIKIIYQYPIFGAGLGNFINILPKFLIDRKIYFLQPAHNIYLLIIAETGVFGFILISYLISGLIRKSVNKIFIVTHKKVFSKKDQLLLVYFFALMGVLFLGLFDHYPITLHQGLLLFTVVVSVLTTCIRP